MCGLDCSRSLTALELAAALVQPLLRWPSFEFHQPTSLLLSSVSNSTNPPLPALVCDTVSSVSNSTNPPQPTLVCNTVSYVSNSTNPPLPTLVCDTVSSVSKSTNPSLTALIDAVSPGAATTTPVRFCPPPPLSQPPPPGLLDDLLLPYRHVRSIILNHCLMHSATRADRRAAQASG